MRTDNANFSAENLKKSKSPRYIIAVSWDTANTDLTYFTSHADAVPVESPTPNIISGVISNISGTSQKIDPINASATIGNITITLIDNGVTDKIQAKLAAGDGLRGKRVIVYVGFEDLSWGDYVIVQTQIVEEIRFTNDGEYIIQCSDIQRSTRKDIFDLATTNITANVALTSTTINVVSTTDFETYEHGTSYTDAPSATVGYFKIGDTIYRYTGKTSTSFTGVTQGVLNTKPAIHELSTTADADRQPKVTEVVYLEMPAVKLAYALLTGDLYNQPGETLPSGWHLNISTTYVATSKFTSIGNDLWVPSNDTLGKQVRFIGLEKQDGKRFLEKEIYLLLGLFSPVLNDGQLSLKRMSNVLSGAAYVDELDIYNVVSYGELTHDMNSLRNQFQINWNYDLIEDDFTRHDVLIDSASIAIHGSAKLQSMDFRGLDGFTHTQATLAQQRDGARDRYTGPPLRLSVTCLPSLNKLEVGDVVRVNLPNIRDYSNSPSSGLDRSFEIQQVQIDWITGAVKLDLFGSSQRAALISATTASVILDNTFYTPYDDSPLYGTNLTSALTIVGGVVTANGSLTGNANMTASGAVYCYDGDLTINTGVTVTISQNIQLRIKGELVINGAINGKGNGLSGATGGGGTAGTVGGFGVTKAGNGVTVSGFSPIVEITNVTQGDLSIVPLFDLDWDGINLSGLPDDLRGTSGGAGGDVHHNSLTKATGGNGGNGGAGLCIISRGVSFGVNGEIDLSGDDGGLGGTYEYLHQFQIFTRDATYTAGSGAGGSPGGLLVLLDGAAVNEPDNTDIVLNIGNSPDAWSYYEIGTTVYNLLSARGYTNYDQHDAAFRVQRLAENLTAEEDIPALTSVPLGITLVEVTNTPQTPAENLCTVEVTVTPPSDGNYSYSNIYYKLSTQTSFQYAGAASDECIFVVPMDGLTYDVRAHPVSIFGYESDQFITDSITVSVAAGYVVLGPGNSIGTDENVGASPNTPGIIFTDEELSSFDGSGNRKVHINATTGDATFKGHLQSSWYCTSGSHLTAAHTITSPLTTVLNLYDTSDFASSGSGYIIDSTNNTDAFSWTGKTSTTLTGCTGLLAHNKDAVVVTGKATVISLDTNETYFFGSRDVTESPLVYEVLATLGITNDGSDYIIGNFGSYNSGNIAVRGRCDGSVAIYGISINNVGIQGDSTNSYGVYGWSGNSCGGYFEGADGPIELKPSASASAPTHSANKGTLWVTSAGILYINTSGSTTWQKVGGQ